MNVTPMPLSAADKSRLQECEAVIEAGMSTFVSVGSALLEIRESKLYRQHYNSYEEYCQARWSFTASRARQLIAAAGVALDVASTSTTAPTSERQARKLAPLPPAERKAAWQEATESAQAEGRERPSGRDVDAAVQRRQAPRLVPDPVAADMPDDVPVDAADAAPDLLAELERANAENARLEALVASLQASDLGAEVARWEQKYQQLEGRLRQVTTTSAEAQQQATYAKKRLAEIRSALGVERDRDILPTIEQLRARAA